MPQEQASKKSRMSGDAPHMYGSLSYTPVVCLSTFAVCCVDALSMPREGILFAYGNPLLDISAEVDESFLGTYGLKANDAILADDKHKTLYNDLVEKFQVDYAPGGATQNTIRIAQWMIGIPRATTFMGCIGKDKFGQILEERTKAAGVRVTYQYHDTEPTGTCAVLITGKDRSLVAYLAAANLFSKAHLDLPENQELLQKAEFYYSSSFPLTVCPEAMLDIAKHSAANDKSFSMNLSAPFLCSVFKKPMLELMPYVDILFGNESEAVAFADANDFGTKDIPDIAKRIASMPKQNGRAGRIVIITQGADPTLVYREGTLSSYPVIHIKKEEIVDTNGAGDAFVGGFLAHLVQGDDIETCIRAANYAANLIIQRSGCTYPEKPTFKTSVF
ncbi:Adenosine kinase 1 [Lamellibrachia satsuma]|nr:Adenosine kinase 1 [Lamellibrachia satsuma]